MSPPTAWHEVGQWDPHQRCFPFLVVCRQIVMRERISKNCAFVLNKDFATTDVADWVEIARGGQDHATRATPVLIGSLSYLRNMLDKVKEVVAQHEEPDCFTTRSFNDTTHPLLLGLIGVSTLAPFKDRQRTVQRWPPRCLSNKTWP